MFEFEPKITEELKGLKNVVLAPHVGNATFETRDAMAETAVRNILAVLNGEEAVTPVNQKYSLQKKETFRNRKVSFYFSLFALLMVFV